MDVIYADEHCQHDNGGPEDQSILECSSVMTINDDRDELIMSLCLVAMSKPKKVRSTFYLVVFLLIACASQGDVVVLRVPCHRDYQVGTTAPSVYSVLLTVPPSA